MVMYNPVGSTQPKDLSDNAQVLDKLVVGTGPSVVDRLGRLRYSWAGMEYEFQNAQDGRDAEFQQFLGSLGYAWVGDYAAGVVFNRRNEYTVRDGVLYRPAASAALPLVMTGTWATDQPKLVVMDLEELLRADLANSSDPTLGAALVARAVSTVSDIPALLQAPKDASQLYAVKGYHPGTTYGGAGLRQWNPGRSKADHNGGTVIDPDKVFPADWADLATVQTWFVGSGAGTGCWETIGSNKTLVVTEFGAVPNDPTINNQPSYAACAVAGGSGALIIFPPGNWRMHWFFGYDDQKVIGYGATLDLFKLAGGPTVLAAGGNRSKYYGLYLNCLETNLPNVRTTVEDRTDSYWADCSFVGFRDAREPNLNTAWGLYAKRSKNHTFERCYFENNSQNDIALLEGCENIRIISPRGPALNINIEPNSDVPKMRGIIISDSVITKLLIQENSLVGTSGNMITIEGCRVLEAFYDGGAVDFQNCEIVDLQPAPDANGRCYAGSIRLNGAVGLSPNLLRDPTLVSVSATDSNSSWQLYTGTVVPASRYAGISTGFGRGLKLNPNNASGTCSLQSEQVPVSPGQKFLVGAISGANYPVGAGSIGIQFGVRWLNSSGVDISNTVCPINRGPVPSVSPTFAPVAFQAAVVVAPAGAAFARVLIGSTIGSATTSSSDWYYVGLHQVSDRGNAGPMTDPTKLYAAETGFLKGVGAGLPSSTPTQYYYRDYLAGDRMEFAAPAAGGFLGCICTAGGAPGTWKNYGPISA